MRARGSASNAGSEYMQARHEVEAGTVSVRFVPMVGMTSIGRSSVNTALMAKPNLWAIGAPIVMG